MNNKNDSKQDFKVNQTKETSWKHEEVRVSRRGEVESELRWRVAAGHGVDQASE